MVWWCVMGLVFPADWACGLKGLSVLPVWLHCQCMPVLPWVPCSLITPHRQLPQTISQKNYYLNTALKFWFAGELFLKRCQLQQDNPKPAAPCGTPGASWTLTRIQIKQDSSTVMNGKVQLCEQDLLCSSVRSGINFLEENIFRQWLKIGCCSSCQDTQAHESVCGERARRGSERSYSRVSSFCSLCSQKTFQGLCPYLLMVSHKAASCLCWNTDPTARSKGSNNNNL